MNTMNRILGTLLASALLTACNAPRSLTTAPPAGLPAEEGAAWTLLGATPSPRTGQASVYDAARDRMLVFGGGSNDLWAQPFSGPNANGWERIEAGGEVPPPISVTAVIDEGSNQLMVFPADSLERAWTLPLDGSGEWTLTGFGAAPKISLGFSLAMDAKGRRLFAYTSGTPEAWVLSLDGAGTWERLAGPPEEGGFSCRDTLVFDGDNARLLVLSGGWPRGDVYALPLGDTSAWIRLNQQQTWFDYGASAIYDAKAARFLVAGPQSSGWIWSFAVGDPAGQWTHLKVSAPVSGEILGSRWGSSGVYDARQHRLVIFGGTDSGAGQSLHDDTWAISLDDAPAWSRVGALDDATPQTMGTGLAVTPGTGSVVRFGGVSTEGTPSTLAFDAKTTRWRALGDAPTQSLWSAGAWDPAGHRLVTFGGYTGVDGDQTWALDVHGKSWTELDGAGARPAARSHHSMVPDPSGDRLLVFGGTQGSSYPTYFGDTWALDVHGDHWSKLDVSGHAPAARSAHAAAFDDAGRRMFVNGGTGVGGPMGDTWMLELEPAPHWVKIARSPSAPPPLSDHFAAFDPVTRRFVVVGNVPATSTSTFDGVSVWALSTDGKPSWQRYCPKGTRPAVADGAVWADGAVLVTAHGSTWRFDDATPACD
jgi:hypothetical protein